MQRRVVTKYRTIAGDIRRRIESGELPVGAAIPSESDLCITYEVARGTIRQAVSVLQSEDLVTTGQGRRAVVCERPVPQPIDEFVSFSAWVRTLGRKPGQRTIEMARRRRDHGEGASEDHPTSEYLVHVLRLRFLDGRVTMLERSTFHDCVGRPLLSFDADSGSIYEFVLDLGAPLDVGHHVIDAVPASAEDAELLEVAVGSPLIRVTRQMWSADGVLLEYSDDRYRPDRAAISLRTSRAAARAGASAVRTTPN